MRVIVAITAVAAVVAAAGVWARDRAPHVAPDRTLFRCTTDHLFTLLPAHGEDGAATYRATQRREDRRDIRLAVDADGRAVILTIGGRDGHAGRYPLRDLRQASSPGSGTGGWADTAIVGRSSGNTFTLFAGYDSNGFDHSADLQIIGASSVLFTCGSRRYEATIVKNNVSRSGNVGIYTMAFDGLASPLDGMPGNPDTGNIVD